MTRGHMSKPNVGGSLGWNMALNPGAPAQSAVMTLLSLSSDGSLGGNSDRNPRAQWRLVAAGQSSLSPFL
jgi:hypothetical protein